MTNAKLIVFSPERLEQAIEIDGEASVGRASDNLIRIDDPLASQYHAVIERRGSGFWVSDLGSTNGTTVNGEPVASEHRLQHRDLISIGGVAGIAFHAGNQSTPQPFDERSEAPEVSLPSSEFGNEIHSTPRASQDASSAGSASRMSGGLMIAAVVVGVALAGGAVWFVANAVAGSEGSIRIISPETGTTIRAAQTIRVEAEEPREIEDVTYLLDGVEFAIAEAPPFEVQLDPAQLSTRVRNLTSGNHVLTATVRDKDGNQQPQADTILLAFEMRDASAGSNEEKETNKELPKEIITVSPPPGSFDVVSLSKNLAATISGKSGYDFDPQFADEIRRRTDAYRVNVMDDASRYRRQIGSAFTSKGLPPAIGFVMGMSESLFKEVESRDQKLGFWQVPRQLALEQGYLLPDESPEAIKDVKRSAEIAAAYLNDLVNAFGGTDHFMYAIACYGMPISQAAKVRARLEEVDPEATERKDFWKMVRRGVVPRDGADRVAKFFAAGIVGENPQSFGLNAKPLSSLY